MVKAYVVYGQGIGCHKEVAHAFELAGAKAETILLKQLLEQGPGDSQIINFSGGFLHGDMGGAGMYAANEMEHAKLLVDGEEKRFKDALLDFADKGGLVYAQCNGFQLLVRTGLLPGVDDDYSRQTVTLTKNDCGLYRVSPVLHIPDKPHFAFEGIDGIWLWCRHAEGKLQFYSEHGLITPEEAEKTRKSVNDSHVLVRYADPDTKEIGYPENGSIDGIGGLRNRKGTIFGHMAHTEVSVYSSRDPRWFRMKDQLRRKGIKSADLEGRLSEGEGLKIFRNIVGYFN